MHLLFLFAYVKKKQYLCSRKGLRIINCDMKKTFFICLLVFVVLGLTSCQNNDPKLQKETLGLVVKSNQWYFDENLNAYYCHFDVPQITWDVYNYAEVSINREYNSDTKNAYQAALPETSYFAENEYDDDGEIINTFLYEQHVDYVYGHEFVEIYYTVSDFFYPEDFSPGDMRFRLQITY